MTLVLYDDDEDDEMMITIMIFFQQGIGSGSGRQAGIPL